MSETILEVTALTVYPVKSMRGIDCDSAELTPFGLRHDRRFMVVREDGSFVTQRQLPLMARVETALEPGGVVLSRTGFGELFVPFDVAGGEPVRTRVWNDECETTDQGEAASRWLTRTLESSDTMRLVAMAPGFVRPGRPDKLGDGTHTLFADAAPFLVANEASLDGLNRELAAHGRDPVPMNRFRPNITVRGWPAFAEHATVDWTGEDYAIRLCYPCERCVVTTTDQATGVRDPSWEPYRTLARLNPVPGSENKPAFGQNAALVTGTGRPIRVGDRLSIEEIRE